MQLDIDYCRRRASAELQMAQRAKTPSAAEAHRQLAKQYQKRIDSGAADTEPAAGHMLV